MAPGNHQGQGANAEGDPGNPGGASRLLAADRPPDSLRTVEQPALAACEQAELDLPEHDQMLQGDVRTRDQSSPRRAHSLRGHRGSHATGANLEDLSGARFLLAGADRSILERVL